MYLLSMSIHDRDETRILTHYEHCDESSADDIKRNRGVIRDEQNVICQSFGYTPEYDVHDPTWRARVAGCLQNCTIFRSEEGTLLRLYFYQNKWCLSTHKRLNAFESRWSSPKSFGEQFVDALEYFFLQGDGRGRLAVEERAECFDRFCATLDRECVYTFLLRTNADTKIVCAAPDHPVVYFAGMFYHGMRCEGNPTLIPYPLRVWFESADDLAMYVATLEAHRHQGVIVFMTDQTVFKIMNPQYTAFAKLRGSEPNLLRAYLRIRQSETDVVAFLELFPERRAMASEFEEEILALGVRLHKYYARRFIHKQHLVVNKNYFWMMRQAHEWHCADRVHHLVTVHKMLELLDQQTPSFLYTLLHTPDVLE
jgi:hypothetical protein